MAAGWVAYAAGVRVTVYKGLRVGGCGCASVDPGEVLGEVVGSQIGECRLFVSEQVPDDFDAPSQDKEALKTDQNNTAVGLDRPLSFRNDNRAHWKPESQPRVFVSA